MQKPEAGTALDVVGNGRVECKKVRAGELIVAFWALIILSATANHRILSKGVTSDLCVVKVENALQRVSNLLHWST